MDSIEMAGIMMFNMSIFIYAFSLKYRPSVRKGVLMVNASIIGLISGLFVLFINIGLGLSIIIWNIMFLSIATILLLITPIGTPFEKLNRVYPDPITFVTYEDKINV